MPEDESMNVYDFDETIYSGESSVEFIIFFLREDPSIIRFFPKVFRAFILYEKGKLTLESFMNDYGSLLTDYCNGCNVDIERLVSSFWDRHMHKIQPFYKAIKREDDVIITASPSFMMEDVCRRLGVKNLICTDFDFSTGKLNRACYREEKVKMFFERFPDARIDEFYTDSMNDKFLFPYSEKVFLVKKGKVRPYVPSGETAD